jgi:hypothetical protein
VPPHTPLMSVLDYSSLFMVFSFAGGEGIQSAQRLCWIIFTGCVCWRGFKGATLGAWCSPVSSAVPSRQLGSLLEGKNGAAVFSVVQCREVFHGLGPRMS